MATITSNGTGGGDWSTGSTWVGGVAPTGTDDVVIDVGDTVTKDTSQGSPDCANCTVNGTLAIGSNGIKATKFTGTGLMTAGDNAVIDQTGSSSSDILPSTEFVASSGNEIQFTTKSCVIRGAASSGYSIEWAWVDCDINSHGVSSIAYQYASPVDSWYEVWFYDGYFDNVYLSTGSKSAVFRNCYFSQSRWAGLEPGVYEVRLDGCVFGKDRDGTTNANGWDLQTSEKVRANGSEFHSTTLFANAGAQFGLASINHQGVEGDFLWAGYYGTFFNSVASARTGSKGLEFYATAQCGENTPVWHEIAIFVESGDTVEPSFHVKNVTADADVQDAEGRLYFVLDPDNTWGLYEVIDADALADVYDNWREVSFTGGTAGGSGAKGPLILRIVLARYVASAEFYIADLDTGNDTEVTFEYGTHAGIVSDPGSGGGSSGGLLTHAGMSGGMRG